MSERWTRSERWPGRVRSDHEPADPQTVGTWVRTPHPAGRRTLSVPNSALERRRVEEHPRLERMAVQPRSRGSLRILCLEDGLSAQHPLFISAILHAGDEI